MLAELKSPTLPPFRLQHLCMIRSQVAPLPVAQLWQRQKVNAGYSRSSMGILHLSALLHER